MQEPCREIERDGEMERWMDSVWVDKENLCNRGETFGRRKGERKQTENIR
jgi:hypothetical protein